MILQRFSFTVLTGARSSCCEFSIGFPRACFGAHGKRYEFPAMRKKERYVRPGYCDNRKSTPDAPQEGKTDGGVCSRRYVAIESYFVLHYWRGRRGIRALPRPQGAERRKWRRDRKSSRSLGNGGWGGVHTGASLSEQRITPDSRTKAKQKGYRTMRNVTSDDCCSCKSPDDVAYDRTLKLHDRKK